MIGHFNADDLASYRAGIVSDSRAARISAHLTSCAQCAGIHSGLGDISQLLASIPVPPMPEALTRRVQAAIASEAAQRATPTSALGHADGDRSPALIPGRPDLPERAKRPLRRPRPGAWSSPLLLRGLAAAGVLVLLVGGGILLANQRGVGTSSGLAGPAPHSVKNRPAGGAPVGSAATTKLRYRHGTEFEYANAVTTDVNYTKADLPARIRQEVANVPPITSGRVAPATAQPGPEHKLTYTTIGQLESCLSTVAAGRIVVLVDIARYMSQRATIIVFKPVGHAYDVIVVGEACGAASQDLITRLVVPTK